MPTGGPPGVFMQLSNLTRIVYKLFVNRIQSNCYPKTITASHITTNSSCIITNISSKSTHLLWPQLVNPENWCQPWRRQLTKLCSTFGSQGVMETEGREIRLLNNEIGAQAGCCHPLCACETREMWATRVDDKHIIIYYRLRIWLMVFLPPIYEWFGGWLMILNIFGPTQWSFPSKISLSQFPPGFSTNATGTAARRSCPPMWSSRRRFPPKRPARARWNEPWRTVEAPGSNRPRSRYYLWIIHGLSMDYL